jgi:sarcosine oxidase/L-pipecolate oxidase
MTSQLTKNTSIIIVGAGTWGCSTALHLARRGYKNVTVLDPYAVPSPISAGDDVNKILEVANFEVSRFTEDGKKEESASETLLKAATEGWLKDPVFAPHFHHTGLIVAATTPEARAQLNASNGPSVETGWVKLEDKDAFQATMPKGVLTGDFPGWQGWWLKKGAGWVHARKSMQSAAKEAERLGVKFVTGEREGRVTSLLYENGDVAGAVTTDGKQHRAGRTILAAGASAAQIFPMKNQLRATAWTLAHIKMTEEERKLYKDLPVLFNIERGFFMEPDADNGELKMCDEHPGYCNFGEDGLSEPFAMRQVPKESETRLRLLLRETMPHLAERPFSFARICWCADTPNRAFLISKHPDYAGLVLAVGASGHGFCHIPSIGGFIADELEGTLDPKLKESMRWRPETAVNRDWKDLQGRFGPEGSNRVMDFKEVKEWTTFGPKL